MAEQKKISPLFKKFGEKMADAHKEMKDAPVDVGIVRLPAGIRGGKAKLNKAYFADYEKGDNKGKTYFRATAIVKTPTEHAGKVTSFSVNMFEQPKRGSREPVTFAQAWGEYLNFFKLFKVEMPPEQHGKETKLQAAERVENHLNAILVELLKQGPHVEFSTRGWTPPATALKPKPEEMVFETWHGVCDAPPADASSDPSAGIVEEPVDAPTELAPPPGDDAVDADQPAPPAVDDEPTSGSDDQTLDGPALVEALVAVADGDPTGDTEDGKIAIKQLTEMAMACGKSEDEVTTTNTWAEVGAMITFEEPAAEEPEAVPEPSKPDPVKGAKVKYKGALHEVTTVTPKNRSVTLTNLKTKKPLVGADKKTTQVSWDELEY